MHLVYTNFVFNVLLFNQFIQSLQNILLCFSLVTMTSEKEVCVEQKMQNYGYNYHNINVMYEFWINCIL